MFSFKTGLVKYTQAGLERILQPRLFSVILLPQSLARIPDLCSLFLYKKHEAVGFSHSLCLMEPVYILIIVIFVLILMMVTLRSVFPIGY